MWVDKAITLMTVKILFNILSIEPQEPLTHAHTSSTPVTLSSHLIATGRIKALSVVASFPSPDKSNDSTVKKKLRKR